MPVSKKRKKKGKTVKYDEGAKLHIDPEKESSLTLQDLINVLAYQEYVKDGTIVPPDETIDISDLPGASSVEDDMNDQQIPEQACFDCRKYNCDGNCTKVEEENKDER